MCDRTVADEVPLENVKITKPPHVADLGEWDAGADVRPIPPRGWLLGNIFCRQFASSLLGSGGTGKTTLRYHQYMSLATNRPISGDHVFQRSRVLVISLEDSADELRRRIRAIQIHHGISNDEIKGWLYLAAPRATIGKLLELDSAGNPVASRLAASIKAAVIKHRIDLLAIDPFVKAHGVDENSNTLIDVAMQILTDLAVEHDLAIDFPHHVRKGLSEPGNADAGRGASSQKDAGRLVYTLTTMSPEEAGAMGIPEKDRRSYVRLDSAKVNVAPPLKEARWFRLFGVALGNATALYPRGDEIQVLEPWSPPDMWEGLSMPLINAVLDEIEAGLPEGERYSDAKSATDRAAWKVVLKHSPEKTERQARDIIKTWVKNGVLVPNEYQSPKTRKPVNGLRLDHSKRPS